jgi:YfiH family protein
LKDGGSLGLRGSAGPDSIRPVSISNPPGPHSFPGAKVLEEPRELGGVPVLVHGPWSRAYPWLIQGITRRGGDTDPFDLGLFTEASNASSVLRRWEHMARALGAQTVVHARQVHGASVRHHRAMPPGLHLAEPCDGHATADAGVLLAVTTADCAPVSILEPESRAVALVHAGWRGSAAGVVEQGIQVLVERCGSRPEALRVHLGPAICGSCYEVGPEVHLALGLDEPPGPALLDLRGVLGRRLTSAGVEAESITVSGHCTRCGEGELFSHRGGDTARQAGFLGIKT